MTATVDPAADGVDAKDLRDLRNLKAGSFSLEHLLGQFDYPSLDHLNQDRLRASTAGMSTEKKVGIAVNELAYLHETRHLHDAFGTYAGISLFMSQIKLLEQFVRNGWGVAVSKRYWPIPFTGDEYEQLPDPGQWFVRLALRMLKTVRRFRGDWPAPKIARSILPDFLPHASLMPETLIGSQYWSYPANVISNVTGDPNNEVQLIPIAFDTILEGNAQVFERSFLENYWGKEVADAAFLFRGVILDAKDPSSRAPTYNVTDLVITRYLQDKGFKSFRRGSVLALADRALSEGWVLITPAQDGTLNTGMCCAGNEFVLALEACTPESLVNGDIDPYPVDNGPVVGGYIAVRDGLLELLNEPIDASFDPLKDIMVLRNWVVQNVILPLLNARIRTGGRLLADYECYIDNLTSLPLMPFRIGADGILKTYAPAEVVGAWVRVRMTGKLLRELMGGAWMLECPRAKLEPGFKGFDLAPYGTSCDELIAQRRCGRYLYGQPIEALPSCQFAHHVRSHGFAPPRRKRKSPTASEQPSV